MALYYVLDQVTFLEFFTVELIKNFEMTGKGKPALGTFKSAVNLVETRHLEGKSFDDQEY